VLSPRFPRRDARRIAGRLEPPDSVRTLQRKLYRKAKSEPTYRFCLLYDKVYRAELLGHAGALVRANGGAAGVDHVTNAAVEADGVVRSYIPRRARQRIETMPSQNHKVKPNTVHLTILMQFATRSHRVRDRLRGRSG
jgi:hypothetical protein